MKLLSAAVKQQQQRHGQDKESRIRHFLLRGKKRCLYIPLLYLAWVLSSYVLQWASSYSTSSPGSSCSLEELKLLKEENARLQAKVKSLTEQVQQEQRVNKYCQEPKKSGEAQHQPQLTGEQCNLSSELNHLQPTNNPSEYWEQTVYGPMQTDEFLLNFALVRTTGVNRILEVGGFKGDSSWNYLQALLCKPQHQAHQRPPKVYTVDINPVKQWDQHVIPHKVIQKDAATLTLEDLDHEALDLILLDCHAFYSTQKILEHLVLNSNNLLAPQGYIVLHDTGLHPPDSPTAAGNPSNQNRYPPGLPHQPVERLIGQWIPQIDCAFQRISFHDDTRKPFRHGLTILQRRANLDVEQCQPHIYKYADYRQEDCLTIQSLSRQLNNSCPVHY